MHNSFKKKLAKAQGRSEFVIVVNADIRGFSAFSTVNESPNIAMFIKRFYLQMLDSYFPSANFVKTTGDGLLMTFPYSEDSLCGVSEAVLMASFKCLQDFPLICKNDPMINFSVPTLIGFGVARGTACCLYSGNEILDYSGHLLNLCSRLMELARPSGIVVDGNYLESVIPDSLREQFIRQDVYLRGIAEEQPTSVLYLKEYVELSTFNLKPLKSEEWISTDRTYTVKEFLSIKQESHLFNLKFKPTSPKRIRVTFMTPSNQPKGRVEFNVDDFTFDQNSPIPRINVPITGLQALLRSQKQLHSAKVSFRIQYVPQR